MLVQPAEAGFVYQTSVLTGSYGCKQSKVWYNFYTISFEYDPGKSRTNKAKHGIDFEEAQVVWADPELVEIRAHTEDEPRLLVIGRIAGKHWSAVITYRGDAIRIISVRRSRPEEVKLYESI
jgi:hypothetical protein